MSTPPDRDGFAVWGERIALAAAVALTAKGEFDLAVMANFSEWIAWIYPVMLDVYVITAFHKRRWLDVIVSFTLMLFSQAAVHLVPVWIDFDAGEKAPWGLVLAVACIAPIVVVRVKALAGKTAAEREAEARDNQLAADARNARAEAVEADRKRTEAEAAFRVEERKRVEAEKRAEAERMGREVAEAEAAREAEERAEDTRNARAEIDRLTATLGEVQASARDARAQAAEQSELAARISGQLDEARLMAERAVAEKMATEQRMEAVVESRESLAEELAKAQQVIARLQQRAESADRRGAEISAPPKRKSAAAVPPALPPSVPGDLPPVDGVSAGTVARVISAYLRNPTGKREEIAAAAGTTPRTARKVLNNIPADHPVLAIEAGTDDVDRAAV